jgi:hypothetical protein
MTLYSSRFLDVYYNYRNAKELRHSSKDLRRDFKECTT